ncbi:MAG: GNAT family N-acetyltransferase [Anaerolineaceae bacterium]|nr:GNAT family N-acetyltransferase [Anaerolineaceae bacterium]
MIIETENLRLRSFVPDDLDAYFIQVYGDAEVMRYISGGQARNRERTDDVLQFAMRHEKTYGFSLWALLNRADNQFIGHCGLIHPQDKPEVELVCALGKDYQKQGLGPESASAALRYGFENAHLERIIGLAYPENVGSRKGMEKLGMSYVGMTEVYYNATLTLYELKRADWRPSSAHYRLISE